jgi:tetratricopeptide (TPR) repeat protein
MGWFRLALMLLVCLPGAAWATAQLAVRDGQGFDLTWPQPVKVRSQQDGRELLLQFDQPIDGTVMDELPRRLDGLIDGVQLGYDALLLLLATDGMEAQVLSQGRTVRVALTRPAEPAAAAEATREDADAEARLELERARLLMRTGRDNAARVKLKRLAEVQPNNTEPLLGLADIETRQGRWREAVKLYDRALTLSPDTTDIVQAKAQLIREKGSFLRSDTDLQKAEGQDRQIIERVTGRKVADDMPLAVGFAYEIRRAKASMTPRANGVTTPFDDERHRLDLWGEHDNGLSVARGTLLLGPTAVGGAVEGALRHKDAETRARLAYREPYWDQYVGLVDGGTVDRAEAAHRRTLLPGLEVEFGGRVSRYGLAGDDAVAYGFGPGVAVRWTLPEPVEIFSLGYGLFAEYINRRDTRLNDAGAEFNPMSISSVEIHTADVTVSDQIGPYVRYLVTVGYGADRLNGRGPVFGAELSWQPLVDLEAGLRFNHSETSSRGAGSVVNRGGAYLLWRF